MLEFFVGAGLGVLYVEILYRLLKKGTALALFHLSAENFYLCYNNGNVPCGRRLDQSCSFNGWLSFWFFAEYLPEGVWEAWSF
jgi:hypothetical protein